MTDTKKRTANTHSLLEAYGLVCHTFAYDTLPDTLKRKFSADHRAYYQHKYLSLLANAGAKFWSHLESRRAENDKGSSSFSDAEQDNRFDKRSLEIVHELLALNGSKEIKPKRNESKENESKENELQDNELKENESEENGLETKAIVLYPGDSPAPLMMLGELAGWSSSSPLGLGVNTTYGPWFAYRALFVTSDPITPVDPMPTPALSPCLDCAAPCVGACPANAVLKDQSFNINLCAEQRVAARSICKSQCHARNACPVGAEYRYSEAQRSYHMTHALTALVKWASLS